VRITIFKCLNVVGLSVLSFLALTLDSQAATVVVDSVGPSSSGASVASASTLSWSHTVAGSNTLLTASVAVGVDGDNRTLAVTYNGVPMTSAAKVHSNNQANGFVQLFYLVAPAAGTHTVQVTMTGGTASMEAGSISFSGVNQTTPVKNIATSFGNSTTPAVAVTSASGDMVVDALSYGTAVRASTMTNRWLMNQNGSTAGGNGAQSTAAGASSVTMGYTTSNAADWWAMIGMDIVAASGTSDTTAPTSPASLSATPVSQSQINLSWTASTDNVGVTGYTVYRGGAQVGTTTLRTYSDSGLAASTTYTYTVDAFDAAGNHSVKSASVSAATQSGGTDTQAPAISAVAASNITNRSATITWTTNEPSTSQVEYGQTTSYGSLTTLDPTLVASHTVVVPGLAANTFYNYRVRSKDAAGNERVGSNNSFTTAADSADTTSPSVSMSSPANGASVYGTILLSVNVSDNVAVAGVTYRADGFNLASEVTTAPFSVNVDTHTLSDGNHVLTAVARDTSGNTRTSAGISVAVDNTNTPRTPTLIQHVATATNRDSLQNGNPYYISLPNRTGAGNALIIAVSYPFAAGRTVVINDDNSNTWVLGATTPANPANNQIVSRIYYALNVAAGTQKVTVSFDAPLFGFQANVSEFYNVATVSAADGNSGNAASSAPSVTAGSLTTTGTGDLVYSYAFDTNNTESITGFTAGAGFNLLSADVLLGSVSQYAVQTSPGSINPAVTVSGGNSNSFNAVALALRSAAAGTPPPPGIRIVHVYHAFDNRAGVGLQFPSTGNLLVGNTAFSEQQVNISSISSTPSNTWAKLQHGNGPQMWYAANAATGQNLRITPTMLQYPGVTFVFYDVAGAATSPYDSVAGTPFTWKSNTNNSDLLNLPVIAPSTSGELIFAIMNDGVGPAIGMVGAGFTLDTITYGGEVDRDNFDNADGYAHYYSSSTSSVSFGWQMHSSELPETSLAMAVGFKSAP
jgi:hypothetical protein